MVSKFKASALGVLTALLCLGAATSMAVGAEFLSEAAHTNWSANQVGIDVFTGNAGTVKCNEFSSSGTTTATTTTTLELTPTFKECTAFGFVSTTIDANGCSYRLHTAKEGVSTQGTSIVCPEGKEGIVVTAFNCWLTIPAQGVLFSVSYTNEGGSVKAVYNLFGVKYIQLSKAFPGCTNGTFTNGKYTGQATLTGANTTGEAVGVSVGEEPPPPPAEGEFHSEVSHTNWSANQVGIDVFTGNAGTVKCNEFSSSGTTTATTTTTLELTPTFKECTAFGFVSTTIDANGCSYRLHTAKEGVSTQGTSIVCPEGKEGIVVTAFNCWLTIPPQGVLTAVNYTNTEGDITVDLNLTGVKYTQLSKSFPGCTNGTFTNGTYKGTTTLKATNTAGEQVSAAEGKELPPPPPAAEFHSEVAHTEWRGEQTAQAVFGFNAGSVTCGESIYFGTSSAATGTTITLVPQYTECTLAGSPKFIPIDVGGCTFQLHTHKEPSLRNIDILCPAGEAIVITGATCYVRISSQSGLKAVSLSNEGAGSSRDFKLKLALSGLTYTQETKAAPGCTNGAFTNGSYSLSATVRGFNTLGERVGVWVE